MYFAICTLALSLAPAAQTPAPPSEYQKLTGTWKIVAMFEDGQAISQQHIATEYVADGVIKIDGPMASILPPGSFERRQMAFTVNEKADPKTIDLVGASKVGSKGIYMMAGQTLMICFPMNAEKERPADFGAGRGSGRVLMTLKRQTPEEVTAAAAAKPQVVPWNLPAAPKAETDLRKSLIGTWGHQDEHHISYYTLNADGSFSSSLTWKKGFDTIFRQDIRSSGSWKVTDGVIIVTITTSTEKDLRNQVYSWRVTQLGPKDLVAVDNRGRPRHEWRVR